EGRGVGLAGEGVVPGGSQHEAGVRHRTEVDGEALVHLYGCLPDRRHRSDGEVDRLELDVRSRLSWSTEGGYEGGDHQAKRQELTADVQGHRALPTSKC